MKSKQILLSLMVMCLSVMPAGAQSWVKKAAKSVFVLKTFDANGTLLGSAGGVYVGTQGEAVSSFAPFKGASSAVVIDASGKEYAVDLILGASDTYDVAKFRVATKKTQPATLTVNPAQESATVWLYNSAGGKGSGNTVKGTIGKAETFNTSYTYYTVRMKMPENAVGMPLFDDEGMLLGLMQQPAKGVDTLCYAVGAAFADSLKMTGLSINDATLRSTNIKKALPDDPGQALLSLFMASSSLDSAAYVQLVDDFIDKFPDEPDGYINRAQMAASADRYAEADNDMKRAVNVTVKKDEAHYSYSRLIYQKLMFRPQPAYEPWTMERALEEAQAAYEANPLPLYRQQQAYVLYAQKDYAGASTIYETLVNSQLRSPELFVEAASCKLQQADSVAYLALLDSAVSLFSKPYLREAAPYILTRAQARMNAGKYREATTDLNDYEQLMAQQVNDSFYYLRFQAERGGRIFQPALNDITKAIAMNPDNEMYYSEKASLEVRVGLYDDAIQTAQKCIAVAPEYSDGHLFLGLAQCLKGNKKEGVKNLLRAKELGDTQVDDLIEKYGK